MRRHLYLTIAMLFMSGCNQANDRPLLQTTWNLAELNNREIQHPGPQMPHIRFESEKVTGNDGCNNFFGEYNLDEDRLTFSLLASTRMACPQLKGFDIEFNSMLSATASYRISGNRLELFENDKQIAGFVAAEQSQDQDL
jgi:heat shock protein HslJ